MFSSFFSATGAAGTANKPGNPSLKRSATAEATSPPEPKKSKKKTTPASKSVKTSAKTVTAAPPVSPPPSPAIIIDDSSPDDDDDDDDDDNNGEVIDDNASVIVHVDEEEFPAVDEGVEEGEEVEDEEGSDASDASDEGGETEVAILRDDDVNNTESGQREFLTDKELLDIALAQQHEQERKAHEAVLSQMGAAWKTEEERLVAERIAAVIAAATSSTFPGGAASGGGHQRTGSSNNITQVLPPPPTPTASSSSLTSSSSSSSTANKRSHNAGGDIDKDREWKYNNSRDYSNTTKRVWEDLGMDRIGERKYLGNNTYLYLALKKKACGRKQKAFENVVIEVNYEKNGVPGCFPFAIPPEVYEAMIRVGYSVLENSQYQKDMLEMSSNATSAAYAAAVALAQQQSHQA